MRPILRKLRGALGTALTWAVVWAVGGFAFATLLYVRADGFGYGPFWEFALGAALTLGLWGLTSGALFSGALTTFHRRRALGELEPAIVGLWGGVAGCLGVIVVAIASNEPLDVSSLEAVGLTAAAALVWGGVGMATAVGTVRLAQELESSNPRPTMTIIVVCLLFGGTVALLVELADSGVDPTEGDYWNSLACAEGDSVRCQWLQHPESSFERWRDSTEWATGQETDFQVWIDCCARTDSLQARGSGR